MTLVETPQDAQNELATRADLEKMESGIRVGLRGLASSMKEMEFDIRTGMREVESDIRADLEKHFNSQKRFIVVSLSVATAVICIIIVSTASDPSTTMQWNYRGAPPDFHSKS